jgi:YesN/AraC family two-component response regulator
MNPANPPGKKWRVLIADDVHETRRSTRLMLSTLDGYEVVAIAANGLQAVEMAKEHRPDILLMDVNMPELDGLTAFGRISRIFPDMACIIISAENDPITLGTAEVLGVQVYLIKPFIIEELENALNFVTGKLLEVRARKPQIDIPALEKLAEEYTKARRTDDQSVKVFEMLARDPLCKVHWLRTLALLYAIRQEWGKLKMLAERLEREAKK